MICFAFSRIQSSWEEFFGDLPQSNPNNNGTSQQNCYISKTIFTNLSTTAVHIENKNLLVEDTTFDNIIETNNSILSENPACIYYSSESECCVQNKVLSRQCKSTVDDKIHHFYSICEDDTSKLNYFVESSISACGESSKGTLIYFNYGNIQLFSSNITNSKGSSLIHLDAFTSNMPSCINFVSLRLYAEKCVRVISICTN